MTEVTDVTTVPEVLSDKLTRVSILGTWECIPLDIN